MRFQACTIIARNYLAHARVLYRSFSQLHPEARFTALVIDAARGELNEPFETLTLADIGLPEGEEARMPMLYNVTELATAVKPWFFRHLFEKDRIELLYFDPDIEIFSPVDWLARLAGEHCLVLTPHTTQPMSRKEVRPNETDILGSGAYNLGFLGLNPDSRAFLDWWSERLLREATIDFANMRFTDQRWMDFAPGYFDAFILKDETCNVAYWNADSRRLSWTGSGYEVNGRPLCFFHFSGFKLETPHLLSVHQGAVPRTRLSENSVLTQLCGEYADKLKAADHSRFNRMPYRWDKMDGGPEITRPMRLAYQAALRSHEKSGTPAPPTPLVDPGAFMDWLNESPHPRVFPEITRYFLAIHSSRPDLQAAFPNLFGGDSPAYYDWLNQHGRYEIPIPTQLFPRLSRSAIQRDPNSAETSTAGVTITGYFRAELGTGESGRLMAATVEAAGENYCTQIWSETASRQHHPWNDDSIVGRPNYDTNLICINADELPCFGQRIGREFFRNRYNIGLWFWEVDIFPSALHGAFNFLNEIWVTSEFNRRAIAKVSPVPVFILPHPLKVDQKVTLISRSQLDIPEGFLFLFMFDFSSVTGRKNPCGVIEAFQRAFAPGEGPVLVIKSINGDRNVAELERLRYACRNRSDIVIRDGYLSAPERDALTANCDCYVSLHRSEGFGMTIAEAMLMEKPAIATGYSGNLEFMNDANSFLCGYKLRPVGRGHLPYPPDALWAEPDLAEAAELMRFVYENPEEAQRRAKQGRIDLRERHAPTAIAPFIRERLSKLRQKPPAAVPFIVEHPERPILIKLRSAIDRGVNVRRIVPPLLTWIFQGPRRAMKRLLRDYEQHRRQINLSTIDAFKEIDAEWMQERTALNERIRAQEAELHCLKEKLEQTRRRLSGIEKDVRPNARLTQNTANNGAGDDVPSAPEKTKRVSKSGKRKKDAPAGG